MVEALCGDDLEVARLLADRHPSTGILAATIGLGEAGFDKVILSGFSFEITHAYADNPLIARRGTSSAATRTPTSPCSAAYRAGPATC